MPEHGRAEHCLVTLLNPLKNNEQTSFWVLTEACSSPTFRGRDRSPVRSKSCPSPVKCRTRPIPGQGGSSRLDAPTRVHGFEAPAAQRAGAFSLSVSIHGGERRTGECSERQRSLTVNQVAMCLRGFESHLAYQVSTPAPRPGSRSEARYRRAPALGAGGPGAEPGTPTICPPRRRGLERRGTTPG